jgi:hypothetical protein
LPIAAGAIIAQTHRRKHFSTDKGSGSYDVSEQVEGQRKRLKDKGKAQKEPRLFVNLRFLAITQKDLALSPASGRGKGEGEENYLRRLLKKISEASVRSGVLENWNIGF